MTLVCGICVVGGVGLGHGENAVMQALWIVTRGHGHSSIALIWDIQLCAAPWQACAPTSEPAMSARRKYLIAALIALLWGGAMLAAFWWFEARYLRTFDGERAELFSGDALRSEEHTSALQSLMSISYAVFWLKKK